MLTFTFGYEGKNNGLLYDQLVNKWSKISAELLADAEFKALFTFPPFPTINPDDLVNTAPTLPIPGEDNEPVEPKPNSAFGYNSLLLSSSFTIVVVSALIAMMTIDYTFWRWY